MHAGSTIIDGGLGCGISWESYSWSCSLPRQFKASISKCVHSVASMHSGVFETCFDLFLDAVSKHEEYKAKSEKAKENAINRLKQKNELWTKWTI